MTDAVDGVISHLLRGRIRFNIRYVLFYRAVKQNEGSTSAAMLMRKDTMSETDQCMHFKCRAVEFMTRTKN